MDHPVVFVYTYGAGFVDVGANNARLSIVLEILNMQKFLCSKKEQNSAAVISMETTRGFSATVELLDGNQKLYTVQNEICDERMNTRFTG